MADIRHVTGQIFQLISNCAAKAGAGEVHDI
jgi:hypothetical protein